MKCEMEARSGIAAALAAAILFGIGTPGAKLLLGEISPWLLAGLLYLGSGLGLTLLRLAHGGAPAQSGLSAKDVRPLAAAIASGGIIGPVLLLFGLSGTDASTASLLLNAEAVFTALLAWFAFGENVDRRVALGMAMIVAGAVLLSWQGAGFGLSPSSLLVLGACLAWAIDNNLTRKVAHADAVLIAAIKGWTAGAINLALSVALGAKFPAAGAVGAALVLGFLSYGLSLALFVVGLRHLGTARTGAYFSVAPFFGATLAVFALNESLTLSLAGAGLLMAAGVWLHLTERHEHEHVHEPLEHIHWHEHDQHHQHEHAESPHSGGHAHWHRHDPICHSHRHFPDTHHRHRH